MTLHVGALGREHKAKRTMSDERIYQITFETSVSGTVTHIVKSTPGICEMDRIYRAYPGQNIKVLGKIDLTQHLQRVVSTLAEQVAKKSA